MKILTLFLWQSISAIAFEKDVQDMVNNIIKVATFLETSPRVYGKLAMTMDQALVTTHHKIF